MANKTEKNLWKCSHLIHYIHYSFGAPSRRLCSINTRLIWRWKERVFEFCDHGLPKSKGEPRLESYMVDTIWNANRFCQYTIKGWIHVSSWQDARVGPREGGHVLYRCELRPNGTELGTHARNERTTANDGAAPAATILEPRCQADLEQWWCCGVASDSGMGLVGCLAVFMVVAMLDALNGGGNKRGRELDGWDKRGGSLAPSNRTPETTKTTN